MKKLTDEQIQAMLDENFNLSDETPGDQETRVEMERYRVVFSALKSEPEQGPPLDFAAKVTRRLRLKLKRKSDIRFNLLAAGLILLSLLAAYGALMLVDINAGTQFLQVLLKFKFPVLIAVFVLLGSLILDQRVGYLTTRDS